MPGNVRWLLAVEDHGDDVAFGGGRVFGVIGRRVHGVLVENEMNE